MGRNPRNGSTESDLVGVQISSNRDPRPAPLWASAASTAALQAFSVGGARSGDAGPSPGRAAAMVFDHACRLSSSSETEYRRQFHLMANGRQLFAVFPIAAQGPQERGGRYRG